MLISGLRFNTRKAAMKIHGGSANDSSRNSVETGAVFSLSSSGGEGRGEEGRFSRRFTGGSSPKRRRPILAGRCKPFWPLIATSPVALLFLIGIVIPRLVADQPVIKPLPITNEYFWLTITNGSSTNYYEIYCKIDLDPMIPWSCVVTGALGQTNFSDLIGPSMGKFFRAAVDNDWDHDGVLNIRDANPYDTNVGALFITIDSPTNGATLNQ